MWFFHVNKPTEKTHYILQKQQKKGEKGNAKQRRFISNVKRQILKILFLHSVILNLVYITLFKILIYIKFIILKFSCFNYCLLSTFTSISLFLLLKHYGKPGERGLLCFLCVYRLWADKRTRRAKSLCGYGSITYFLNAILSKFICYTSIRPSFSNQNESHSKQACAKKYNQFAIWLPCFAPLCNMYLSYL